MNRKTTIYLPEEMKAAVEREAQRRQVSEADVIRQAIAAAVSHPRPEGGFLDAPPFADRADELLAGFGER